MESSGPGAEGGQAPPVCAEGTQQRVLDLDLGVYVLGGNAGCMIT